MQIKYTGCLLEVLTYLLHKTATPELLPAVAFSLQTFPTATQITVPKPHGKTPHLEETVKQMVSFLRTAGFVELMLNSYPMPWICN